MLHWLSQQNYGTISLDLDSINHRGLSSFADLRGYTASLALEDCMGDNFATLIKEHLSSEKPLTLHLGSSLPPSIQSAPLAWCNLGAIPLHDRLCIEYYSPEPYPDSVNLPAKNLRFFDFWQESNAFLDYVKTHRDEYIIDYDRGVLRAENSLNTVDLSQYGALVIAAHGSEDLSEKPLIDDRGEKWSLPAERSFPALIVISACGSECGNLAQYSCDLLALRGVQTVIAPVGKVDAKAMVNFFDVFIPALHQGKTALQSLQLATLEDKTRVGAARLCLFGNGSLRVGENLDMENWRTELDVNRLTLQRYQSIGDFSDAVFRLYSSLKLKYDDPNESDQLFRKLHGMRKTLWPVTYTWLAPYMARLAQQHDHGEIKLYQRLSPKGEIYQATNEGLFFYYLAGSEYRQGRYVAAANSINRGLQAMSAAGVSPYGVTGVKLCGLLINILVDINLPIPAHQLGLLIERAFDHNDYEPLDSHETDRFTLLDRQARVAVRQGDFTAAKEKLRRKLQLAKKDHEADGLRELATLALVSAWDGISPDDSLIDEVRRSIPDFKAFVMSLQQTAGLNSYIYILKGFSAIAWRADISNDRLLAAKYTEELRKHYDYLRDSGPISACIFYGAISGDASAKSNWPAAEQWLADDGYFLELSVYSSLLRNTDLVANYLNRFHSMRTDVAKVLAELPVWPNMPNFAGLTEDIAVKEQEELRILLSEEIEPSEIKNQGLLPL